MDESRLPYKNPLKDKGHPLHQRYLAAREAQSSGRPDRAQPLWEALTKDCQPGTAAYVESDRQDAVCLRLLGDPIPAKKKFDSVRRVAQGIHPALEAAIVRDLTVWMLENGHLDEAAELLRGMIPQLDGSDLGCTYVYLGRVVGQTPKGRSEGVSYLRRGLAMLHDPEYAGQYLDTLFWLIELRQLRYIPQTLSAARRQKCLRRALFDVPVAAVGGYKGRNAVRRHVMKRLLAARS